MNSILDTPLDPQPASAVGVDSLLDSPLVSQVSSGPTPSVYQAEIYRFVEHESDNLLIEARAGSGKTTTIVKAMEFVEGRPLFLAFNKSIATEIGNRICKGEAKTLNALGHRVVMQNWPKAQLNANRVRDVVYKLVTGPAASAALGVDAVYPISRSISLVKANALGLEGSTPVAPESFVEMIDDYDLGVPSDQFILAGDLAYQAWKILRRDTLTFDFDDQLYLPLYHQWTFPKVDTLFVDEAQDLSPVQHAMLAEMARRTPEALGVGARIIAVGDRFQAIYGFRGASHGSMDEMKRKFGMQERPLSISYRCAQAIVREAQRLCPSIEYRDGAGEGSIEIAETDPELFDNGVLVLCRTNAPLFRCILTCIRLRRPCVVLSNFLDSFQNWIKSFKKTLCRDLLPRLDSWYDREREAALERGAGRSKLMMLRDKYDTAKLLASEFSTVAEMLATLKSLSEGRTGPIFSTIHKAKGLEADRVYLLRPDLCPPPWVDPNSDQFQQEQNLLYVAITRARTEFTYGVSQ